MKEIFMYLVYNYFLTELNIR